MLVNLGENCSLSGLLHGSASPELLTEDSGGNKKLAFPCCPDALEKESVSYHCLMTFFSLGER